MKIEDEIQQKSFKNPQQKLAINLLFTVNWLNLKISSYLKSHNLTHQQYNILRILRGQKPKACSLKFIKARMLDKMSDTSRVLDNLVKKKLAHREICPGDRRQINIQITEKWIQVLKQLDIIDDVIKDVFASVSDTNIEQLNNLLDQIRRS